MASVGVTITVTGDAAVITNLMTHKQRIESGIIAAFEQAGQIGLNGMNSRVPVRTGRLKGGNKVEVTTGGLRMYNDVPYCIFVELGTSRMHAHPFIVPAWLEAQQYLQRMIESLLS